MKSVLSSSAAPTFTASTGTLNFATAVASYGFQFGRLLGIINLTQNAILYTAGVSGYGGTWNSGTNVLTLTQTTTGMSNTDVIEVIWDDPQPSIQISPPLASGATGWPASSIKTLVTTASTNSTVVKASPGIVGGIYFATAAGFSTPGFLKIYDSATAPTAGSGTIILTFGNTGTSATVSNFMPAAGIKFSTGIAFTVTANAAASDTASSSAGNIVNIMYV